MHSNSCDYIPFPVLDWLTCELKLRLECILDLGVGTVKSFFGEWPLFIILHLESYDCIPFPVHIGIHVN